MDEIQSFSVFYNPGLSFFIIVRGLFFGLLTRPSVVARGTGVGAPTGSAARGRIGLGLRLRFGRRGVLVIVLVKARALEDEPDIGRNHSFDLRTAGGANGKGVVLDGLPNLECTAFFTGIIVSRHLLTLQFFSEE